jgi:hypothetical protein
MNEVLAGALKSKTMAFGGGIVLLGVVDQFKDIVPLLVPEGYRGVAIATVGLIVALLRMATTQPLADKAPTGAAE